MHPTSNDSNRHCRTTTQASRYFTYKSQTHFKTHLISPCPNLHYNQCTHRRWFISAGGSDQNRSSAVAHPSGQHQQNDNRHFRRRTASSNSSDSPSSSPTQLSSSSSDLDLPFWQRTRLIVLSLVMALSFFGIAIFLFVTLESDHATSDVDAATSQGVEVSYGSVIKLMHENTKFRLHSHALPYGSGSGQQSVTSYPNVNDANSYWIVRPEPETFIKQGESIKSGTIIRLQHLKTRKWLHSHLHASPISRNLEVSCFGDDGSSDSGDQWKLEIEGSGETWKQDQKIRLHHVDMGGYLHSHEKKFKGIVAGQQEVCGVKEKSASNIWLVAEGIFFMTAEKK